MKQASDQEVKVSDNDDGFIGPLLPDDQFKRDTNQKWLLNPITGTSLDTVAILVICFLLWRKMVG